MQGIKPSHKKFNFLKTILLSLILSILLPVISQAFYTFPTKIDTKVKRMNIQTVLNTVMTPSPNLKVDGVFGRKTIQTIQAFQDSHGLVADGKIGPITRATLESAQTGSTFTYTPVTTTTGCSPGTLYNTQTGALCNISSSILPTGCNGTNRYSTITGVSCGTITTNPSVYIPPFTTVGGGGSSNEPTYVNTGGGGGGGGSVTIVPVCTGLGTQSCTITNGTGNQSRTCVNGVWSSYGLCSPVACDAGYQEVNNVCVATTCTGLSTGSCTISNGTGNQSRTCTQGSWSSFGSCAPISCNAGYFISGNTCILTPDTTKPTITAFTIPSTVSSLAVPISSLTASDDKGVTGFLLSESSSTPNPSSGSWTSLPATIYTFLSQGLKTLYAWARDAAGNVSNALSRQTTITIPTTPTTIIGVISSSNDGHVDTNTLDRVFTDDSRWSANGDGQWITYQLSQVTTVSYVRIAFYAGSQRYFDIQSSADNINWQTTTAYGVTSAANMSNQYQTFSFQPVNAKYIKIIGHGNSNPSPDNGWISITEMDINGFAISLATTPQVCVPELSTTTCNGKCGTQVNNCGTSVSCASCTPTPSVTGTTYAVIGDSMSNDISIGNGDWPGFFITKMGLSYAQFPTYAVAGNTCSQVYDQLVNSVANNTTYLFITCGINGYPTTDNQSWYTQIYNKAKAKGISHIFMTTIPPNNPINTYDQTTANQYCTKMQTDNNWLKNFASQHSSDLSVVDLWSLWHDTSGTQKTICGWRTDQSLALADGIHPNATGADIWAQKYVDIFNGGGISTPAVCTPEATATTCLNKCGTQTNNCGTSVSCSACSSSATPVILYQNTFEQRPLGTYSSLSDFMSDWSNNGGGNRWNFANIVSGISGDATKALEMTYPFYDKKDFKWVCYGDSRCNTNGIPNLFATWPSWAGSLSGEEVDGVGPASGGGQWEINLPSGPDHGGYKELYFSYKVKFSDGFNAVDGGKIPGLCGSDGTNVCPGGGANTLNSNNDAFRFSARMMFESGNPAFYLYYPGRYGGDSASGDVWELSKDVKDGNWHTVVQRVVLNDLNTSNGLVEGWVDGVKAISQGGFNFRSGSQTLFGLNRVYFSTFFGGDNGRVCTDAQVSAGTNGCAKYSDGSNYLWYAPRKTEKSYFDNLVVYYYPSGSGVVTGNQATASNKVEIPPIE